MDYLSIIQYATLAISFGCIAAAAILIQRGSDEVDQFWKAFDD